MREYILAMVTTALVTYLLVPLVKKLAIGIQAITPVRDRDVHSKPTPRMGGLAMFGGLCAGMLVAWRLPHLGVVFADNQTMMGLLEAGALLVLLGIADDKWELGALTKLAGQVAAAGILILYGVQISWLPVPSGVISLPSAYGELLTIVIVVATINAVNFIDGLDGLAGGIVGISGLAFFLYAYLITVRTGLEHETAPALIAALLGGMCFGFLPHNFSPAKIFMGDTGSMLIGLMLAAALVSVSSFDPTAMQGKINRFPTVLPLIPALMLVVPYMDMLMAVFRRGYAGRSPIAPDKKHMHHRLLELGHSHRGAAGVMYLWTALFAFGMVGLSVVRSPVLVLIGISVFLIVALLVVVLPQLRPRGRRGRRGKSRKTSVNRPTRPRQPV